MNHHYSSSCISQKVSRLICSPRYSQLSAIFGIERIKVCMTSQTLIVRHIRQEWIIWIKEITIPMTLDTQVVYRWRQLKPWSLTKTIYRLLCRHFHDQSTTILLLHWISHTLPQSSSIQEEAHSPFHCPQPRWTRRMWNIPWALIAHGVQCRSSPLVGFTQYSGSIVVGC